jgi:hypothetical protein
MFVGVSKTHDVEEVPVCEEGEGELMRDGIRVKL